MYLISSITLVIAARCAAHPAAPSLSATTIVKWWMKRGDTTNISRFLVFVAGVRAVTQSSRTGPFRCFITI